MARVISLGEIELTTLRNYRWEIRLVPDGAGGVVASVTESYVVTDEGYAHAPEGLKQQDVPLLSTERKSVTDRMVKYIRQAVEREQVSSEIKLPEAAI